MKTMNNLLDKNVEKICTLFLFLQPFLDVITAISIKNFSINLTIGSITRFLFLAFCFYYLLFINKEHRKKNWIYLGILFLYFALFFIVIFFYKDTSVLFYELKNTLNTFYFPIVLLTFIAIFTSKNTSFSLKKLIIIYSIYILFIIFPIFTHTSFLSYSHSKLGTVGWFLSANAIGNILSFLFPLLLLFLIKYSKKKKLILLLILFTLYAFISMGTKVPILSLVIIFGIDFVYYFIYCLKNRKYKNGIICISLTFLAIMGAIILLPKTSFYKNLEIHKNYLKINSYTEIFTNYNYIDKFIFSERLTFLKNTNTSYKKASFPEKIIGIGYIENYHTSKESTKTIEIDYLDIFYRHGIIGTILFFIPFLILLIKIVKKLILNINFEKLQYLISILLILLLSLFSGHLLITPSVSIYVALLLSILYSKYIILIDNVS